MKRITSMSYRALIALGVSAIACQGPHEESGVPSAQRAADGPSVAATQLVTNGGFEQGSSGWTLSGTASVIAGGSWSHGGTYVADFCDQGTDNTASLRQTIAVPADATTTQLTFWLLIYSSDTSGSAMVQLDAKVIDGGTSQTLGSWDDMHSSTNLRYLQATYDLSAYRGKTITLSFDATERAGGSAGFYLDDVSVTATTSTTAPTISSFAPTSGPVGTTVTVSGTNFTGATAVKFNGVAATFTVQSASQITATVPSGATTGPISVTTSGGTATSSGTFTVDGTNPSAPSISGFTPTSGAVGTSVTINGANFTGATAVRFNGVSATFTVQSAAQITTTVPSGATTGPISVVTPNGTAASAAPFTVGDGPVGNVDFYVSKIEIGQATQRPDNSMRLAQDKRAYIRVFMQASAANSLRPSVRVQTFLNGVQTYEATIATPTVLTGVPTGTTGEGDFDRTWMDIIPANIIKPGLSVKVTADPTMVVPDANRANNVYPATGNLNMDVKNTYPFRLTIVPLEVYANGSYWTPYIGYTEDWTVMFQRIWPVPEALDTEVHSVYSTYQVPLADYSYGWDETLNELLALAAAEGATNRYYYGAYSPYYGTGGGSGMAFLAQPVAMGIDWDMISHTFTWKTGTVAHELGHSLNRPHSPCGGPAEPDPYYPYPDGSLGTWGYDTWTDEWYDPNLFADVMGYCGYSWVSDYSVDKVMDFRLSGDSTVPGPVPAVAGSEAAPVPSTLVWGRVVKGVVQMNPAFTIQAVPRPTKGSYRAELLSDSGQVIGSAQFEPASTDNGSPDVKGFVLTVPIEQVKGLTQRGAGAAAPAIIRISRDDAVQATQKATPAAALAAARGAGVDTAGLSAKKVGKDRVQIRWDVKTYPMIMVKNLKGEVIGMGRGGEASVRTTDARLEIHQSDGTQSHAVQVTVK